MLNINKINFHLRGGFSIKEEWKPIIGWENKYEVSNYGNVRNINTNKYIIGDINNCGYYRVSLYDNGKSKKYFRHRLVAMHFIDNPNEYDFVNHKDGDKSNNSVINLEWCTQSYNEKHAFATGLKQKTNSPFIVIFENNEIKRYENQNLLADEIGVCQQAVSNWLNGKEKPTNRNIKEIYFVN